MDCKKISLVTTHHNELRYRISDLSRNSFTSSCVCDNPLIHTDYEMRGVKNLQAR